MKKEVMLTAWAFVKEGIFSTIGEALKAAWNKIKLVAKLKKGVAYFQFKKADGTTRNAIGTLKGDNFDYTSKGTTSAPKTNLVKFWDLEKRAFRSLNMDTFIAFN